MVGPSLAQENTHTVTPGESIQDAIDNASPGDTIQIESGTYEEHIEVTVANLTLVGVEGDAVIEGTTEEIPVLNVTAPGVTIDSLTVTGGTGIGNIDAENRTVDGTGDGIKALGAEGLTIVDSRVVDNDGWGVNIRFSPSSRVEDSTLTNNVWDGAIFIGSNGSVARNNNASGNGIKDGGLRRRHGIRFTNTSHGFIENNTAANNAYGGILFTNPSRNNTVRNNVMRGNANRGFGTFGAFRGNRVVNNTIVDSGRFGILTYSPGGNNTFANNVVKRNGGGGIHVDDTDGNVIRNNTVVGGWVSIRAAGTEETVIANNTVRNGNMAAISAAHTRGTHIQDNRVLDSELGVRVMGKTGDLVVVENRISGNEHGVAVKAPATGETVVAYNDIVDNDGYGAVIYRGSYDTDSSSFDTVPDESGDIADFNATQNYWGSTGPAQGAPEGGASNTVGPNVVYEPATDASTAAPAGLTVSLSGGDSEDTDGESSGGESSTDDSGTDGDDASGGDDSEGSESSDESDDSDDGDDADGSDDSGDGDDADGSGGDDDSEGNDTPSEDDDSQATETPDDADESDNEGATMTETDETPDGESPDDTGTSSTDDGGPGFGILAGLTGLVGAAIFARRRTRS